MAAGAYDVCVAREREEVRIISPVNAFSSVYIIFVAHGRVIFYPEARCYRTLFDEY